MIQLRDYQQRAVDMMVEHMHDLYADTPARKMLDQPTGTGKSYELIEAQRILRDDYGVTMAIITPGPSIATGFAKKMGLSDPSDVTEREANHLWTIQRYLNRVLDERQAPYDAAGFDEAHHSIAPTWAAAVAGISRAVFVTATPFRATPRATRELHALCGPSTRILSIPEAVAGGWYAAPEFHVKPFIDDDNIDASSGEFKTASAEKEIAKELEHIIDDIHMWHRVAPMSGSVIAMPSVAACELICEKLGLPHAIVVADTKERDRERAFDACLKGDLFLAVVDVLAEGVDRPFRRLHCAKPMRSAVSAMQLWGRFTRPQFVVPQIIEYTRNLERHAHLFRGVSNSFKAAEETQMLFGGPSRRGASAGRFMEIEKVKRFKAIETPLYDGGWAESYTLYCTETTGDGKRGEYCIICAPHLDKPVASYREDKMARWQECECPMDLEGYRTFTDTRAFSEKQESWYRRQARLVGLDPEAELNRRQFAVFVALTQSMQHVRK